MLDPSAPALLKAAVATGPPFSADTLYQLATHARPLRWRRLKRQIDRLMKELAEAQPELAPEQRLAMAAAEALRGFRSPVPLLTT